MGTEVKLIMTADNQDHLRKIKEVQEAHRSLNKTVVDNQKREKGLIEDIEDALTELQAAKKKAYSIEDIAKYNQKIVEAKHYLKEYEDAGVSANENIEKKTNVLEKTLSKLALTFLSVTAVIKTFKGIVESTEKTALAFHSTINGLKSGIDYLSKSIATFDFSNFISGMRNAIKAGSDYTKELEKIQNIRRQYKLQETDLNAYIEEQRRIVYENDKTAIAEKIKAADNMLDAMDKKSQMEVEIATKTYNAILKQSSAKNKPSEEDIEYSIKNFKLLEETCIS